MNEWMDIQIWFIHSSNIRSFQFIIQFICTFFHSFRIRQRERVEREQRLEERERAQHEVNKAFITSLDDDELLCVEDD